VKRRSQSHIGRTRIAAAKILTENLGFEVRPEEISVATGRNRSDWRMDVYRWELFGTNSYGSPVVAGCWERLTDFVKIAKVRGCFITDDREITYKEVKNAKKLGH
jgi:hypothetical protein